MKHKKRPISTFVLFVFCLFLLLGGLNGGIMANADTKDANLLVLGDSIGYGMSASAGNGFGDLYVKHLAATPGYGNAKLTNLAVPGDKTEDLMTELGTQQYKDAVAKADIIVVSIGGNHLLSPVIAAMCKAFNVNYKGNPNLLTDLVTAVKTNPDAAGVLAKLQSFDTLATLSVDLTSGVSSFKTEFPAAVTELKKQAPNAQFYFLNLYNPFPAGDLLNSLFDSYINGINTVIMDQSKAQGFTIVDVNSAFKTNADAVKFNISASQLDPHPTDVGHQLICKQLIAVEKPLSQPAPTVTADPNGTTAVSKGLTDAQKTEIKGMQDAAKSEQAAASDALKKAQKDSTACDKQGKDLRAKLIKAKLQADKDSLVLQILAADAQKKAATATAALQQAIINRDTMIIKTVDDLLSATAMTASEYADAQQQLNKKIDDAKKQVQLKQTAADKANAAAKAAAAKIKK